MKKAAAFLRRLLFSTLPMDQRAAARFSTGAVRGHPAAGGIAHVSCRNFESAATVGLIWYFGMRVSP
jgi:hypothetical protein